MRLFCNHTDTTEIYTYWHTLSLHDALPSLRRELLTQEYLEARLADEIALARAAGTDGKLSLAIVRIRAVADVLHEVGGDGFDHLLRSEEHTSELQSLMRNSYAVFCLTNKNNYHVNQHSCAATLPSKV